jgi:hypothetical protein
VVGADLMLTDAQLYRKHCAGCTYVYNTGHETTYAKCDKTRSYVADRFNYGGVTECPDRAVKHFSTKRWLRLYFKNKEKEPLVVGGERFLITTYWFVRQFFYLGDWILSKLDFRSHSKVVGQHLDKAIKDLENE